MNQHEARCRRCNGPNVVWSAPSPLWNRVMRGGSINGDEEYDGIVCPVCFVQLAEERGAALHWRLYAEDVRVELETVTPSGRTWNDRTWRWEESAADHAVIPAPDITLCDGSLAYLGGDGSYVAGSTEEDER